MWMTEAIHWLQDKYSQSKLSILLLSYNEVKLNNNLGKLQKSYLKMIPPPPRPIAQLIWPAVLSAPLALTTLLRPLLSVTSTPLKLIGQFGHVRSHQIKSCRMGKTCLVCLLFNPALSRLSQPDLWASQGWGPASQGAKETNLPILICPLAVQPPQFLWNQTDIFFLNQR